MNRVHLGKILLGSEQAMVTVRQAAKDAARALTLPDQDGVRLATAVSEMARNAFRYARGGRVDFELVEENDERYLQVTVQDQGEGIPNLQAVLRGEVKSRTGMGIGLPGTPRLVDFFDIQSSPQGTKVVMRRQLPVVAPAWDAPAVKELRRALERRKPPDTEGEMANQNRELLEALAELSDRRTETDRLNQELMETNRGMVALHAELEDQADALRRVSEQKTRLLSNMSHELRTPLNSILSLSKMLLAQHDGPLHEEQIRQARYIRSAGETLLDIISDLLDLAKVEAGKVEARPQLFSAESFLSSLRGIMRPLATSPDVELYVDDAEGFTWLVTDEGKLAQILRNLISNALKYTEKGEVRLRAHVVDAEHLAFTVRDSGIGIAREDQERVFGEFEQVEGSHQRKVRGTGLGLPLSRKLAELLGGSLTLESELGQGSVFTCTVRAQHGMGLGPGVPEPEPASGQGSTATIGRPGVLLVVDDDSSTRYLVRRSLPAGAFDILEADGGELGLALARKHVPGAMIVDVSMSDLNGLAVVEALRAEPETARIPIVVHTSRDLSAGERARIEAANCELLPKGVLGENGLQRALVAAGKRMREGAGVGHG